jgi:hypothetical protein
VTISFRHVDNFRKSEPHSALSELRRLVAKREAGVNYDGYEFSEATPRVRYSLKRDDYRARFPSVDAMNSSFHQSHITDGDLLEGKFSVVAKMLDFETRKLQYRTIELTVPRGSTVRTVNILDVFQQFCDVTNEIPSVEGYESDSDESVLSGEEIVLRNEQALSHDQRVYCRRDLLNRLLKWTTMTTDELLECYSFTG